MLLKIDPKIFEQYPDYKAGALVIKRLDNTRRNSVIDGLLRGVCAQRTRELEDVDLRDDPMVRCWDRAYGNFGANPLKKLPLITALLEIVQDGNIIKHIDSMTDLCNYFALKFKLPVFAFDTDWLCGDLKICFTKGGESFRPRGSIEIEKTGEGEVAYLDNGGVVRQLWNHMECERTKITHRSTNAVIMMEDVSGVHLDRFGEMLREVQLGALRYLNAEVEPYLLNSENFAIELGVDGRKNADDSRIPQQEMAHFLKKEETKNE